MKSMSIVQLLILLLILLCVKHSVSLENEYRREAHNIMKRMADAGHRFDGFDVARVHLIQGEGVTKERRRISKRDVSAIKDSRNPDGISSLELELGSGSTININLKPAGIVDPETLVVFHTESGQIRAKRGTVDCYFHGEIKDSSGSGPAAVSHCDGLYGFANSQGYRYFLHPVGSDTNSFHSRYKRQTSDTDNGFDINILWANSDVSDSDTQELSGDPLISDDSSTLTGDILNPKEIVLEMAMFQDAAYWKELQATYPGREDDFLLTRLAGSQALFSNKEKIGYDFKIKLKHIEYWHTDPENYTFTEEFPNNLKSGCDYTTSKVGFDVHAINTGISAWNEGVIGLAYFSGTCTPNQRCLVMKGTSLDSFQGFAHEVGHTLGMNHFDTCPDNLKSLGGFMGGGNRYNFSPCMKYQFDIFVDNPKKTCIFEETYQSELPADFTNLANLYPGQIPTPDKLCRIIAGEGYRYAPRKIRWGHLFCQLLFCVNDDESTKEYGRARLFDAPVGYPCTDESMCDSDGSCRSWDSYIMAMTVKSLQDEIRNPIWSEWSEPSNCSRPCGTGVRLRRRQCGYTIFNTAPFCPGDEVEAELCNREPCPDDPIDEGYVRQKRGDEICQRFKDNGVELNLRGATEYFPIFEDLTMNDLGAKLNILPEKSCLMKCKRNSTQGRGEVDAFLPDGSPCFDHKRSVYEEHLYNIESRCLRGECEEFSDCPKFGDKKDKCGICGGDGSRCVEKHFESWADVPSRTRRELAIVPNCSFNIDLYVPRNWNIGVIMELWSKEGELIIGDGGRYYWKHVYEGDTAVNFAGVRWTYDFTAGYMRSSGRLNETIVLKVLRRANPIRKIAVRYALAA